MMLAGGVGWWPTPLSRKRHGCRVLTLAHANLKVCISAPFSSIRWVLGSPSVAWIRVVPQEASFYLLLLFFQIFLLPSAFCCCFLSTSFSTVYKGGGWSPFLLLLSGLACPE